MYYVLGSRELVAPASAGAPPLPAQPCTSQSILESYTPLACSAVLRAPAKSPPLTPKRSRRGGILRVRDV
jgi:hypothetical protein